MSVALYLTQHERFALQAHPIFASQKLLLCLKRCAKLPLGGKSDE